MKVRIGEKYITRFHKIVPECDRKWWMCHHESCMFFSLGWQVHMVRFGFLRWLVWEPPTVEEINHGKYKTYL